MLFYVYKTAKLLYSEILGNGEYMWYCSNTIFFLLHTRNLYEMLLKTSKNLWFIGIIHNRLAAKMYFLITSLWVYAFLNFLFLFSKF